MLVEKAIKRPLSLPIVLLITKILCAISGIKTKVKIFIETKKHI